MPKISRAKRPRLDGQSRLPGRGARISLAGAVVRTKKDKGYLAEMAFVTKAMSLGFNVCKPMGETPGFDFILESGGFSGSARSAAAWTASPIKVQIKSGWVEWHGGYPVKISSAHRCYRRDETDFIIVFIIPEDAWYVLPVAAAAPARMASFFPHITNSRGRLEIYRDAWHLLGRPARAARKAQLSGNLPVGGRFGKDRKISKREFARELEKKLGKSLPQRRAQAAWEALGGWLFSAK
jgi:hypothetical protein